MLLEISLASLLKRNKLVGQTDILVCAQPDAAENVATGSSFSKSTQPGEQQGDMLIEGAQPDPSVNEVSLRSRKRIRQPENWKNIRKQASKRVRVY